MYQLGLVQIKIVRNRALCDDDMFGPFVDSRIMGEVDGTIIVDTNEFESD